MKTTLYAYRFNLTDADQRAAYESMAAALKAQGLKKFRSWGGGSHYLPDLHNSEITLETKHVFNNRWNTAATVDAPDGRRVFDWAEDHMPRGYNQSTRQGHYLTQTDAMRALRHDRVACGFCGHQESATAGSVWCTKCLGNVYLTEADLHLLRLRRVDDETPRPALTAAEDTMLRQQRLAAQLRLEREIADVKRKHAKAKHESAVRNAAQEYAAATWVLDHCPGLFENWIYYPHVGRSCFGWVRPLTPSEEARLLNMLGTFPGEYDIKRKA